MIFCAMAIALIFLVRGEPQDSPSAPEAMHMLLMIFRFFIMPQTWLSKLAARGSIKNMSDRPIILVKSMTMFHRTSASA